MEAFRFFQYIDNTILFIKSSNERNSSEELNIDFRENDERVFEYSFEKFEMKIGNENESKPLSINILGILIEG